MNLSFSEQSETLNLKDHPVSTLPRLDGDVVLRDGSTVRYQPIN